MCACRKYYHIRTAGRYHDIYYTYIYITNHYIIEKAAATILYSF